MSSFSDQFEAEHKSAALVDATFRLPSIEQQADQTQDKGEVCKY